MLHIYHDILKARSNGTRLLAVLIDPDKVPWDSIDLLIKNICASPATHIFIGGSIVFSNQIDELTTVLKACNLPILIFPGDPSQVSLSADGLLLLSLISGRNPDFLIGHHVEAAITLKNSGLEIISTGYILIDGGSSTAVSRVSRTTPISPHDLDQIISTAVAAELIGHKLIYLEAGSGAKSSVPTDVISAVRSNTSLPLIVGGGIRSLNQIEDAYIAGADLVVIGTAFEQNIDFFKKHD